MPVEQQSEHDLSLCILRQFSFESVMMKMYNVQNFDYKTEAY